MDRHIPLPPIGGYSAAPYVASPRVAPTRTSSRDSYHESSPSPNRKSHPMQDDVSGFKMNSPRGRTRGRQNRLSIRSDPGTGSISHGPTVPARHSSSIPLQAGVTSPRPAFLKRSKSEDCIKCMLKVPHDKCEAHKYIRIGGGYRHSYWCVKAMLEQIELQRQKAELLQQRLEAIHEKNYKAIKTYIRTKSGRLKERIIFLSEEDYNLFKAGGKNAEDILKKFLSKEEAANLACWDEEEQKAITTFIRTKSGRRVEKVVYISKSDYEAMKRGEVDARALLSKYVKPNKGEQLEGWEEAEMIAVKTYVRTKSGRKIEKTIFMSKEDYEQLKNAKNPEDIMSKYMTLNEGEALEDWKKESSAPMKVIKAMVRTKSGRMVEKTILMTEEEFNKFQESGGDVNMLKKYLDLGKDDVIENWDKASTVYSASDEEGAGKVGGRIKGKDGHTYEIVVDPITGKKYKKRIGGKQSDNDSGFGSNNKRGAIKGNIIGAVDEDPHESGMTKEQKAAYRAGARRDGSDSEYSYTSYLSDGGTRHVRRRHKRADGTYSDSESYNSGDDAAGKARRQNRRQTRKSKAIKEKKERFKQGKRNEGSDSDFSYRSIVSAGGRRHVRRRRKKADGTYSGSESYHSSQDEGGAKRRKKRRTKRERAMREGKRNQDSDSDYSYRSVMSAGGTRHVRRRKKRADGTYSADESYHSSQDGDGKERRRKRRQGRQKAYKGGKRRYGSDSEYSYRSVVSAGGTRRVRRKHKRANGMYSDSESYHSSQDEGGDIRRRRRRRDRKHAGSANSYRSVVSAGGTRHVRRRRRHADGTYSSSESYHSSDSDFFDKGKLKKGLRKKRKEHGSDSDYSYKSDVSAGGTRRRTRVKRIRDKQGKVIGHGKAEEYTSPSEYETDSSASSYEMVADGKGGYKKVKKEKSKKKKGKRGGGPDGNMSDISDSLLSTDSEDEPDLSNMTEEEKAKYLESKAKRKAEREKKRKEKYGRKYEEMMEKHNKAKEAKKAAKSMVTYGKGGPRFKDGEWDDREPGLAHDERGRKGKKKKDGHEADDESDESEEDEFGRRRKKKPAESDTESIYEYMRDEDGNILMDDQGKPIMRKLKKKKKPGKPGEDSDSDYDYKYNADGKLTRTKKPKKDDEESDGDYFEVDQYGNLKLKAGKKKIDISKLSLDDLRKLGIDPRNMTKEEIARKLKEQFGDAVRIVKGGQKIGLKHASDFGSGADTDDLANDSDLDMSTLKGQQKIKVMMRRKGQILMEQIKKIIEEAKVVNNASTHPEERDAPIDFLKHYQLVESGKVDTYARAFVVEDEDLDAIVTAKEARQALDGVPSIQSISEKQMEYILKVLDIDRESKVTFRMFAVMTALAERVTHMDQYCKKLLEISDLADIERKMDLYRALFYCNIPGDRDPNYIKAESLRIELMAGGLAWDQQDYIMSRMQPNTWQEISFLDYLTYIPLFMSMHDKMCANPLDMSNTQYRTRPVSSQRDHNPLGHPLKQDSVFITRKQRAQDLNKKANELLSGKRPVDVSQEGRDIFNKYQKLPHIAGNEQQPPRSSYCKR